jgi:hypothetical protein
MPRAALALGAAELELTAPPRALGRELARRLEERISERGRRRGGFYLRRGPALG